MKSRSLIHNGMKWVCVLFLVALSFTSIFAQNRVPQVLNYTSGQSVLHQTPAAGDSFSVSFHGGSVVGTTHQPTVDGAAMAGFKYGTVYAPKAFEKDMFVSKGYYPDYIQLSWELVRYQSDVTSFKIYRKELGSSQSYAQVANLSNTSTSWRDEYAEAGVMYQYKLYADGLFPIQIAFLNVLEGVGFRLPSGKVSGRVTYAGGGAVEGVSIIAETDDNFSGTSMLLNGTNSYLAVSPTLNDPLFQLQTFTFQAWLKPTGTGTATIFEKGTQYKITQSPGSVSFIAGSQTVTLPFTQKVDTFFNVTAVRSADSLKLYVLYNDKVYYKKSVLFTGTTPANDEEMLMGKNKSNAEYYKGYIDEIRLWQRDLPESEILLKTFLIISGTEDKLSGYYRMNEGVGENFYDLSRKGFTFNEKHGFISNATWAAVVPLRDQLAVKGVTDYNGNYLITGIPYTSDGSTYRLVPVYGIHSFDPTQRLMFIGPGSNTYSDVNFTDVASFQVTGEVFYEGTRFPVEGVQVRIDGKVAVTSAGLPITTDATGTFKLDVPIGKHQLQLEKYGHVFIDGGYFPSSTTYYDFQQPLKIQTRFYDSTRIKVIGKVVGGPVQAAKPKGMLKTSNNIGNAKIVLTTQKEWDLKNNGSVDSTGSWKNEYFDHKVGLTHKGKTTAYKVDNLKPKEIEIRPDAETGEYVAYLLPEKYVVKSIVAGNPDGPAPAFPQYTFDNSFLTTIDLSSSFSYQTAADSTIDFTDFTINPSTSDTTYGYLIDSVKYQANQDFIFRLNPTVSMTSSDKNVERFWEEKITANNGVELNVVSGDNYGQWTTPAPIFLQRNVYRTKIAVFEQYVNVDKSNQVDKVPVIDGKVRIQNDLAIDTKTLNYSLNSAGELDYTFTGGLPNITTGGIGDFMKSMTIKVFTGKNGSIVSDWPTDGNGFKGYLFGSLATGNNFVTAGPIEVSMILRDPYGSNSYSYYETGNSSTTEISFDVENGESIDASATLLLGQTTKTFAGIGAGVIVEAEVLNNIGIGINQTFNHLSNETTITTTTNTTRWSTSAEPDFVGADGDVFIGNSSNIVYGKCISLQLMPSSQCDADANCVASGTPSYYIGLSENVRISPQFGTAFQYTQNHIENYLIPNLRDLRNQFLKKKVLAGEYIQVIPPTDPNYGRNNTPATLARLADGTGVNGDSYLIRYPANWPDSVEYVDSVAWYNSRIKSWEDVLAKNEREKINATLIKNYSYDAGTVFESSTTYESSGSDTKSYQFSINPYVLGNKAVKVNGMGVQMTLNATYNHAESRDTTTTTTNTQTFGFVFNDTDEGDYYSIDVKKPASNTGSVFYVRGGQSKCPYVGSELTKYHQIGTLISEATMQREVPQLSVDQAIVNNVPQGRGANYNLTLSNASETGDGGWFRLSIDESSIAGATVQIDGANLGGGRTFFVPGGGSINKVLTIKQAVPSIFNFENVKVVISSLCEDQISDTVEVSAYFQPACSDITLKNPNDKWLVNTSDIIYNGTAVQSIPLSIDLENYNLAHTTFKSIAVQYKASSSSAWITDMVYYVDQADYNAASEPKQWINGQAKLNYIFETKSLQDRNYDVRLKTLCADGTENYSTIVSGIKDVKRPKLFGTPQPGDGILSPGDDIMVSFDEPIQEGLLNSFNFSVRGVLNGADIAHNSVLFFDGIDDNLSIIDGVNLKDKSFTIEFWTQRINNNAGVIYAQGELELGFNAANQFYTKFGSQTLTTSTTFTSANGWMHWAVSFDYATRKVNVFENDQSNNLIALQDASVSSVFAANGRMYIGQSINASGRYSGYLHDFRIWESAKGQGSVVAAMNVRQSGEELGLSGYWPMDEATGGVANDLSRSHHAIINGAAWTVFPKGYARTFNGSSDYISMPATSSILTKEMDMTVEFWIKAGPQTNKVIFSNGRGDNSDASPAYENIWVIGTDANGKLYAKNNGTTLLVNKNIFNNEWHHVALVVKRIANTTIYIDGSQEAFVQSTPFGGFSGATMALGARQFFNNPSYTYDQHFNGSLDEFRFWGLARTQKLIEMDKNSRLSGDEVGLLAYYPFDAYDVNLVINPTLKDNVKGSVLVGTANGGMATNASVPSIKDSRPVQNVDFNWVVNNDRIVINVTEDPGLIEKTVLEITVSDVEDKNENRLASPITWTAYIKKNTVLWNEIVINKEKKLYDPLTFQVDILNVGGTEQSYIISNIPSWLTINNPNGTLLPDSKKTLTFTINPSTNIGRYEQSIYLSSDFGFKEKLTLNLKVSGNEPDWVVNTSNFEYNMSVVGTLKINGIESTNPDDKIAAFVNGELRGVASLNYISQYDRYEFFLDIYSDATDNEEVTFKVWNAALGQIHDDVTPQLLFEKNTIQGSPGLPKEFNVTNTLIVSYPMNKGWNWISFNVNASQLSSSNNLLSEVEATNGDIIKAFGSRYDQFGTSVGWIGEITKQGGFNTREGYKLKLAKADTFQVTGVAVQTDQVAIPLVTGWNWIGFPSQMNLDINDALGNVNFDNGDFIKGQNSFAIYDYYLGWIGSLKYLAPKKGYMLKSANSHSLTYPNPELLHNTAAKNQAAGESPWQVNESDYSNSMSLIVELNICGSAIDESSDYLGVFVGEECRGYVLPSYINAKGNYLFFLTANSNTSGEKLSFKYFDASENESYAVTESIVFENDGIVGTLASPQLLSVAEGNRCRTTSVINSVESIVRVFPNPFTEELTIDLIAGYSDETVIYISDITGKVIRTLSVNNKQVAWDGLSDNGVEVSDGIYILSVQMNDKVYNTKLFKTSK